VQYVLNLNWTEQERSEAVAHSALVLLLDDPHNFLSVARIHRDLSAFAGFYGGRNVARVKKERVNGTWYARFEMLGGAGLLSRLVNGKYAWVRIWCLCNRRAGLVVGDTTQTHMLIGQRRWRVSQLGSGKWAIRTEAYERPNGFFNRFGMWFVGREKQSEVWRIYFENLLAEYAKSSVTGSIAAFPRREHTGNLWTPRTRYRGCLP
jgi:hypothetical protein